MGKKREGYDMQQRSPAGMEPETLPLCGMYSNHSASKDTPSHLTDFKECFYQDFIASLFHHRGIQVLYLNIKLKTEVLLFFFVFFTQEQMNTLCFNKSEKKMPYVLQ